MENIAEIEVTRYMDRKKVNDSIFLKKINRNDLKIENLEYILNINNIQSINNRLFLNVSIKITLKDIEVGGFDALIEYIKRPIIEDELAKNIVAYFERNVQDSIYRWTIREIENIIL